jgi:hypothetical protein
MVNKMKMNKLEIAEGVNESSVAEQKAIRTEQAAQIQIRMQKAEVEARAGKSLIDFTKGNNGLSE